MSSDSAFIDVSMGTNAAGESVVRVAYNLPYDVEDTIVDAFAFDASGVPLRDETIVPKILSGFWPTNAPRMEVATSVDANGFRRDITTYDPGGV